MMSFVARHGFLLTVATCLVALALMIGALQATIGLNVGWNAYEAPKAAPSMAGPSP